jgi:virulence-associated protein VagC
MSFITEVFPNSGVRLPTELEFNKLDKTITIAI